jgi:microcystin-dependent protein
MAKIPRVFQNLFMTSGNASHCGQFGSKAIGAPFTTFDAASIQALAPFVNNGWADAVVGTNKQPFLEDMNGLFRLIFQQLCYTMQAGIPEWDPSTTYFTGSIVTAPGTTQMYGSLVDNNTGNALPNQTSNANWNYLNPASVQPGIISDFGGSVAPFGYLLCDGSSYATATYPALFAAIGYNWGGSGPNFNVPDIRGRASIGAGNGAGLTPRTLAATIGEENHVLVSGEMPNHTHPMGAASLTGLPSGGFPYLGIGAGFPIPEVTGATGGGGAHNNMQPSVVVNKVIKY